jgi:hypothetical protein
VCSVPAIHTRSGSASGQSFGPQIDQEVQVFPEIKYIRIQ